MNTEAECPHCRQHLTIPEELLGRVVVCPKCSGEISIPHRPPQFPARVQGKNITAGMKDRRVRFPGARGKSGGARSSRLNSHVEAASSRYDRKNYVHKLNSPPPILKFQDNHQQAIGVLTEYWYCIEDDVRKGMQSLTDAGWEVEPNAWGPQCVKYRTEYGQERILILVLGLMLVVCSAGLLIPVLLILFMAIRGNQKTIIIQRIVVPLRWDKSAHACPCSPQKTSPHDLNSA